ncbi:RNA methyltransferase [Roseospira marina]|uniref:RNA methyltransferase n=1 Tax=Roseospira marina TaxID=140057 RepID=A0A5M6I7L7_9PROT|nr:RNA methyltransferase [Roseospira marina]KAA5603729.1 RNA methyltransferase [Roseospira marina]MBB4316111.1 tRNA/rRNA methyltransferase [Roseospira marina]MBB5089309.1 tRNA/rRNA methyltransferase [Roseospira marina]
MVSSDTAPPAPAGTDTGPDAAPIVVLVRPQLAENVGTAARAMMNCALPELRLVAPREDWLSEKAVAAASGAESVLRRAHAYDSTEAALADCHRVYATTARRRDLIKPLTTPRHGAAAMRAGLAAGQRVAVLFGPERTGLANDDVALADTIVEVPLNPAHSSLNLAQAVLLVGYEWFQAGVDRPPVELVTNGAEPADRAMLMTFFRHLEGELDACGFLRHPEKRPGMVRNLRALFQRAELTVPEVRTLHGVVKELRWGRRPDRPRRIEGGVPADWAADESPAPDSTPEERG